MLQTAPPAGTQDGRSADYRPCHNGYTGSHKVVCIPTLRRRRRNDHEWKILEVKHLGKAFGSNQVLRDIDFSVSPGDVTCIIGPSGSGKSTLLRCLNMLETPSTGEINYHGTDITSKNVNVPEYRSKVGMVFQNFNLFPHFSVIKNITDAPIKVQRRDKKEGLCAGKGAS